MNLTGINMFKRHIVEFSKNLENGDFLKMCKIRKFDVFPSQMDPFDDTSSSLQ